MKTHHHPTTFVHLINQVGLLGICVALCSLLLSTRQA